MELNKKQLSVIAVYAIVLVAFALFYFIIPFNRTPAVVIMFVFSLISIVLGCGMTLYAFNGTNTLRSKVYGFPIIYISVIYTFAQLALTTFVCIINKLTATPAWISAVLSIILLAFALVGLIAADNARDIVETIETKTEQKPAHMKTFKLDIQGLVPACGDPEAKKLLEKLSDKLKYSDPVSNASLADIEGRISQAISEITNMVNNGINEGLADKIKQADALLDNRNARCKAEKGR